MELETLRSLLRSCRDHGYAIETIEYCGQGEPLTHPNFAGLVRIAREIYPETAQRLITNGNYDYHSKIRGELLDQIYVSCDGVEQASYEKYRRRGKVSAVLKFLADAAAHNGDNAPEVTWKYILFEHNDSDPEIAKSHQIALEHDVLLLLIITQTKYKSARFTAENWSDLLMIAPSARIGGVPGFLRYGANPWNSSVVHLHNHFRSDFVAAGIGCDRILFHPNEVLLIEGWALPADKADPLTSVEIAVNGTQVPVCLNAVRRWDVSTDDLWSGYVAPLRTDGNYGTEIVVEVQVRTESGRSEEAKFSTEPYRHVHLDSAMAVRTPLADFHRLKRFITKARAMCRPRV
jgi:hypothetical protein